MKPHIVPGLIACVGLAALSLAFAACSSSQPAQSPSKIDSERAEATARLEDAADLVSQARAEIPDPVAVRARCIVVVPALVKGALIVGGESGRGFADCQTQAGWSAPAPITVSAGSLGAQIGFQSTELLAVVTSESARRALSSGSFKVGADASAAAGPVGKGRSASSDVENEADVLSYSRSKGLFAGVELSGSTISADEGAIRALYGAPVAIRSILENGVRMPDGPEAKRFADALAQAFPRGARTALRGTSNQGSDVSSYAR